MLQRGSMVVHQMFATWVQWWFSLDDKCWLVLTVTRLVMCMWRLCMNFLMSSFGTYLVACVQYLSRNDTRWYDTLGNAASLSNYIGWNNDTSSLYAYSPSFLYVCMYFPFMVSGTSAQNAIGPDTLALVGVSLYQHRLLDGGLGETERQSSQEINQLGFIGYLLIIYSVLLPLCRPPSTLSFPCLHVCVANPFRQCTWWNSAELSQWDKHDEEGCLWWQPLCCEDGGVCQCAEALCSGPRVRALRQCSGLPQRKQEVGEMLRCICVKLHVCFSRFVQYAAIFTKLWAIC